MKKLIKVAPSILSADFSKMGEEIKNLEKNGADMMHCDVMDGVFVKNISFGPKMIQDIRKHTALPLDCHLMIIHPENYIESFAKAGADIITVHYETQKEKLTDTLKQIKSYGISCGAVINPDTDPKVLTDALDYCDMILLMSVFPGFGGQKFIDYVLGKVEVVRAMIDKSGRDIDLQIDGGITVENASSVISAGANVIVAGSTVFNGADMKETIDKLRG